MKAEIKERIEQVRRGGVPDGYVEKYGSRFTIDWDLQPIKKLMVPIKKKAGDVEYDILSITAGKGFVLQSEKFGKEIAGKQYCHYTVLKKGDFSYNKGNSKTYPQGCIYMLEDRENAAVPNVFNSFRPKSSNIEPNYYRHLFISGFLNKQLYRYINSGVRNDGLLNLYDEDFYSCVLPVPSTKEQQRIAEILTHCDKVIDLKKQLIEEKRQQKKWLMQNLLNPNSGVRLPGFEGSEWKEELFGELFSFGSSLSASREQLGDRGICYLHYGDIHSNDDYYIDVKATEDILPRLDISRPADKFLLDDGDIVFVDASEDYDGASKYVVISNPDRIAFISGLHTIPVRSKNTVMSTIFKRYCFQSYDIKKQIAFYATGMKVLGLNKGNLCKIIIKYPTLPEQTAIANILSTADHEIGLLEQELVLWQAKKKSLMQLLLTGLVRVNV